MDNCINVGKHILIHGDTIEEMKKLSVNFSHKIDFVLTSPPYNAFRSDYYNGNIKINDSKPNEEYSKWICDFFVEYDKLLIESGIVLLNMNYLSSRKNNASNLFKIIIAIEENSNFVLIDNICWLKDTGMPITEGKLTRVWENVFVFIRKKDWRSFNDKYKSIIVGKRNMIKAPNNDGKNNINKACFSSDLVVQLLQLYGAKNNTLVLDNFMGTGTTAVGCEKIGCGSIGIELDDETYKYSINRLASIVEIE